ncbi:MAG: 5-oxoprolinase [Rhodospirillaceae bacterium]|nr:5-oxoprolinase [Rhodospirillaceae bacterium]OUU24781.1 MAG: hypothetical protein CBB97_11135 [Candidatus Endolissoclinum sp. TMED37]
MVNKREDQAFSDPATFVVIKNSLYAAAEEMKVVLAKTAYSPILKVAGDYSCGIFDISGQMVAQGPDLPIHLGSMPDAVKAVVSAFETFEEGDVFIHNDPYFGGSHLPDVNVVSPAFYKDKLIGFACIRAHWPDVGSASPGSYGAVTEIYGEGLRLPPVKLYSKGLLNKDVDAIIFANVRTPDERRGDLGAQIAANRRATERLGALADKYGVDVLVTTMAEVLNYSEKMMRTLLARLPDGNSTFEDFCDGDGVIEEGDAEDQTFQIKMTVEKTGEHISVDFSGTDNAVAGPMNAPLSVTASGVFCALKTIIDPDGLIPPNSGCWRTITVSAPKGCVLNAEFPSPVVYANHEISHRVCDMTFGAVAEFWPNNTMACSQGTSAVVTFGGEDPRNKQRYVSYETIKGGFGARPNKDGINAIASGISNTMNTPIEILEMSFPVRVDEYVLVTDSGGAGRFRGGLGASRTWTVLDHKARASACLERTKSAPFGLSGGKPGIAAKIWTEAPNGDKGIAPGKGGFDVPNGGQIHLRVPGSGGFGDPSERDINAIKEDVLDGYISEEAAATHYGVKNIWHLIDK